MCLLLYLLETKARRGDREYGRLYEGAEGRNSRGLGRERAAVDVDVGPERRSPRYHETCLALESVKESSSHRHTADQQHRSSVKTPKRSFWGLKPQTIVLGFEPQSDSHGSDNPLCYC